MQKEYDIMSPQKAWEIYENNLNKMKFKVIHEDYWPQPEIIKDNIEIDEARVLVKRLEAKYPDNEYFICESNDEEYNPIPKVNWFDKYYKRWNL